VWAHPLTFAVLGGGILAGEMLPLKIPRRGGDEEITLALTEAAELPGTVHFDEEMGSVRFWFADEVVAQWLPPDEKKPPTIIALREALMALVRFTQRAFAAYQAARPAGTFTKRA